MGASVTVLRDGALLEEFELPSESLVVRVGRAEDADIRLESINVSRAHCELVLRGGVHVLRDLGSQNGTYLAGQRIKEHNLNEGDVVTVGEFTLRYAAQRAAAVVVSPVESIDGLDLTFRGGGGSKAPAPAATALQRAVAHLEVLAPGDPRTLILMQPVFLIGSAPAADLRLDGRRASRVATMLLRDGPAFRAVDLSPRRSALRVNGGAVQDVVLCPADLVEVESARLRFQPGLPRVGPGPVPRPTQPTQRLDRPT